MTRLSFFRPNKRHPDQYATGAYACFDGKNYSLLMRNIKACSVKFQEGEKNEQLAICSFKIAVPDERYFSPVSSSRRLVHERNEDPKRN